MEDNIQPVPPEKPVVQDAIIVPTPEIKGKARGRRTGVLKQLPKEILLELEKVLWEKSGKAGKEWMMKNHAKEYPEAAKLSIISYNSYKSANKQRINEEMELTLKLATPNPKVQEIIDAFTTPGISLADKGMALTALFNACEDRKKLIMSKQSGFLDPMLEGLILANAKEQRTIIEKITILSDQISKDSERDFTKELEQFYMVIIAAVNNSYRMVNGNNNYQSFRASLDENLQMTLKSYRLVADALMQPDRK